MMNNGVHGGYGLGCMIGGGVVTISYHMACMFYINGWEIPSEMGLRPVISLKSNITDAQIQKIDDQREIAEINKDGK